MRNTLKVAKWEIKRNATNKTFIISIILTPILMLVFGLLPSLLGKLEVNKPVTLYVVDRLMVFDILKASVDENKIVPIVSNKTKTEIEKDIKGKKNEAFVVLDNNTLSNKKIDVYTGTDNARDMEILNAALQSILANQKLKSFGMNDAQINEINTPYTFNTIPVEGKKESEKTKYIPAIFAGILLLAVFVTGTMTFYSSLQEKKDKMVEILLSSIKPQDLMQGKIIGYFVLGLMQIGVWMAFGIPAAQMYFKIPIAKYIFVPELIPMMLFALGGYLMFSAMFVTLGATMEDVQSATNFQGTIMMIPMLPFFLIAPIISDPSGLVAMVGTYFPLTTPGVMLMRLSLANSIPVWELLVSTVVLIATTIAVVKFSGKLFKTAILMYDKTASAKEMIKWLKY
jgi:ABC-2 type transport system permease protein